MDDSTIMGAETSGSGPAEGKREEEALRRLMVLAREDVPLETSAVASRAAYARFKDAVAGRRAPRRTATRPRQFVLFAAAALLVVVGSSMVTWRYATRRPLTVAVRDGAIDEGGFIRSGAVDSPSGGRAAAPSLRFSDGTEVDLGPSSRARIAETTRAGARVLLEDGHARARVVPRHGAEWWFDAGPCRIQVTGTQFDMHWSAAEQVLEVMLYKGSVNVKGPPAMAGVPMRAGQRLVMDVKQGSVRLTDLRSASAKGRAARPMDGQPDRIGDDNSDSQSDADRDEENLPADAPVVPTVSTAGGGETAAVGETLLDPSSSAANASSGASGSRKALANGGTSLGRERIAGRVRDNWTGRVLAGEFGTVIREAERRGVDGVLGGDSSENLMALADAARYTGAFTLARRSLLKVRSRFPHTASSFRAAFLLGRIAEDQHGNLARASEWYDTYLADAPDDAFRAEAMGRQMTATLRLGRQDRARELAAQYLKAYPQGAYARAARAILSP